MSVLKSALTSHRLWALVILIGIYTALVVALETYVFQHDVLVPSSLQEPLGVVLGMLLVLRSNAAYNRWWEARTIWGRVVNECRNLALKISRLPSVPADEKDAAIRIVIAFPYALRDHLRGEAKLQSLPGFETALETPQHVPAYVSSLLFERLDQWKQRGWIDGFDRLYLDTNANAFADMFGACERINNTPMVASYQKYIRVGILVYLLILAWVTEAHAWLIPTMMMWAYFMAGIEIVAEGVQRPFGRTSNDLALDTICATIERTVREIASLPAQAGAAVAAN